VSVATAAIHNTSLQKDSDMQHARTSIFRACAFAAFALTTAFTPAMASDDPPEGSWPFSFEQAWGVPRTELTSAALIPDPTQCDSPDEYGWCSTYTVGASLYQTESDGPSFDTTGTIRNFRAWIQPESTSSSIIPLEDLGVPPDITQGAVRFRVVVFSGELDTSTGYAEAVSGYAYVVAVDFSTPQQVSTGGIILEPTLTWGSVGEAQAYAERIAQNSWLGWNDLEGNNFAGGGTDAPQGGANGPEDCLRQLNTDITLCSVDFILCRTMAMQKRDHELNNMGVCKMVAMASGAAYLGGKFGGALGAGIGTVTLPGLGTVALGTAGTWLGGITGFISGAIGYCADARGTIENAFDRDLKECDAKLTACYQRAEAAYNDCMQSLQSPR
jgi:hypothetical protein